MAAGSSRQDITAQGCAVMVAAVVLVLAGRLLWTAGWVAPMEDTVRLQMRWLPRESTPVGVPAQIVPAAPSATLPPRAADTPPAAAERSAPQNVAPVPPVVTREESAVPQLSLYAPDGRLRVPEADPGLGNSNPAARVFEHRDELETGIGKRATAGLFSRPAAGTVQTRTQRAIYGRDIQHAEARRPPPTRFNPRLHEHAADLGSEATGDAYKAAPIAFEKAPDLSGRASRHLRAALDELKQRYPQCPAAQRQPWLAAVVRHLDALEQVEYRFNHGADPVEAEHSLPAAADSAYDLARRALWEAERRMSACTGG